MVKQLIGFILAQICHTCDLTGMLQEKGGMKAFGDAMDNGMVLVLSLWGDFEAHMLWLDSSYPLDRVSRLC